MPDQIIDFGILTHKSNPEIPRVTETFINPKFTWDLLPEWLSGGCYVYKSLFNLQSYIFINS